jgi:hypothetical protein
MNAPQLHDSLGSPAQSSAGSSGDTSGSPIPEYLLPGANYIPPPSGIFFTHSSFSGVAPSLETLLPSRGAADRLLQCYFEAVHPIARCVHRPTLEAEYFEFWNHVYHNVEPRASLQAVVFAALFSGAVSTDEATAQALFGRSKQSLWEALKVGVEAALAKANVLRTTKIQTMQAFVMYLVRFGPLTCSIQLFCELICSLYTNMLVSFVSAEMRSRERIRQS